MESDAPVAADERIDELFGRMDRWRHFPAWQLERRADIFFALYLHEVLERELGVRLDPRLIPEMPIRNDANNTSVKVDYVAFELGRRRAWFIELKTDGSSRRSQQDRYLERAKERGFGAIASGLCEILTATKHPRKYFHLARALADHGFLELPPDLPGLVFGGNRRGLPACLGRVRVLDDAPVEVVYVQPRASSPPNPSERVIDFDTFAGHVERRGDALSRRFATSLRTWAETIAGAEPPDGVDAG